MTLFYCYEELLSLKEDELHKYYYDTLTLVLSLRKSVLGDIKVSDCKGLLSLLL